MILIITYVPSKEQRTAPVEEWRRVAEHVGSLEGLNWKYWLRSSDDDNYGGVYLFDTPSQARAGSAQMHRSLVEAGARNVTLHFYEVDPGLSAISKATLREVR